MEMVALPWCRHLPNIMELLLIFAKSGIVMVLGIVGRGDKIVAREGKMRKKNGCTTKPAISLYQATSLK